MPTTTNNTKVRRVTRKTRQAWLKQQKELYRLRRLRREQEGLYSTLKDQYDALKLIPLEPDERRATKELIEVLKFDLHTVAHDIDYYSGY